MTRATVANAGTNEASRALYEVCSFTPWHLIDDYAKPVPALAAYAVLGQRLRECRRQDVSAKPESGIDPRFHVDHKHSAHSV